jgi:hypothetical protein
MVFRSMAVVSGESKRKLCVKFLGLCVVANCRLGSGGSFVDCRGDVSSECGKRLCRGLLIVSKFRTGSAVKSGSLPL